MNDLHYAEMLRALRRHTDMTLDQIREAGQHGADAGWPGLTYTADAALFTEMHRDLIWTALADDAEELGFGNPCTFIGQFTRTDMTHSPEGFDALLAWWALEAVGRRLADRHPSGD